MAEEKVFFVVNDLNFYLDKKGNVELIDYIGDFELIKESPKLRELIFRTAKNVFQTTFGYDKKFEILNLKFKNEKISFDIEGNMKINKKADLNKLISEINRVFQDPNRKPEDLEKTEQNLQKAQEEIKKLKEIEKQKSQIIGKGASHKKANEEPDIKNIKPKEMSLEQAIKIIEDVMGKRKLPENVKRAIEKIKSVLPKLKKEDKDIEKTSVILNKIYSLVKKANELKEITDDEEKFNEIKNDLLKTINEFKEKYGELGSYITSVLEKLEHVIINLNPSIVEVREGDEKIKKSLDLSEDNIKKLEDMPSVSDINSTSETLHVESVEPATKKESSQKIPSMKIEDIEKVLDEMKSDIKKLKDATNNNKKIATEVEKVTPLCETLIDLSYEAVNKYNNSYAKVLEYIKNELKDDKYKKFQTEAENILDSFARYVLLTFDQAKLDPRYKEVSKQKEYAEKIKAIEEFVNKFKKQSSININDKVWLKESKEYGDNWGYVIAKTGDKLIVSWNNCDIVTEEKEEDLVKDVDFHQSMKSIFAKQIINVTPNYNFSKYLFVTDDSYVNKELKNKSLLEELQKIQEIERKGDFVVVNNKIAKILSETENKVNVIIDGKEISLFKYQI